MTADSTPPKPYPEVSSQPEAQRVRVLRRPALRQRAAALRPPAHRLREGRRAALPDHARPAGRAALRLGLPRPAGRDGGREGARRLGRAQGDHRVRHRPFNDACRTSVLRYTGEWERYVTRQARWVDFANDYKTMDLSYMESVMWAFKRCGTRASSTRRTGSCPTRGAPRRRCRTSRSASTTPPGPARTRRSRSRSARAAPPAIPGR
jgi:hypothetical protein